MNFTAQIERLYRRVLFVFGLGKINLVDDSGPIQTAQATIGFEMTIDGVPMMYPFGFSSNPPIGSDFAYGMIGGDPSKMTGHSTSKPDVRYKNLVAGGAVMYDSRGRFIVMTENEILVFGNGSPIRIEGNTIISGNLNVTGDITDRSGTNNVTAKQLRDKYNAHVHTSATPGNPTSTTSQPAT